MTIPPETLMAYADGELDPIAAKRVERAMADDPRLAAKVEQHLSLSASLRGAFAPIVDAPVSPTITAMLRESAVVAPIALRQARRERPFWIGAVAASLVAGLLAGPLIVPARDDLAFEGGHSVARGRMAQALDTQLASAQPADAAIRIGVTFHDRDGRLCRTFERGQTGGIACATGQDWQIDRLYGGSAARRADYRQAGSADAIMAEAQAMMAGAPLDQTAEAKALVARRR